MGEPSLLPFNPIKSLKRYYEVIEDNVDSMILFTYQNGPMAGILSSALQANHESDHLNYYGVVACKFHSEDNGCEICHIMDYAEIDRLPVILFFKNRVLKGEVVGFEPDQIMTEGLKQEPKGKSPQQLDLERCIHRTLRKRRLLSPLANDLVFHIMNMVTLGSVSAILRDLWHAQGVNITIRRCMPKHPRKSWERCYDLKKEEWRAIGIMSTLMTAAAAALLSLSHIDNHSIPRLLCLASIICNLGSAIATTTLLGCFESAQAMRLAWFKGRGLFVLTLSTPSGWLRWGIVTLSSALLVFLWVTQPIATKALGTILVAAQFILFFVLPLISQQFLFWGPVKLITKALPLSPEGPRAPSGDPQPSGDLIEKHSEEIV